MNENTTKSRNYIIAGVFVILLCALALRSCGLHDNGSRADKVREQLNAAGRNQQSIADGIADVEGTADSIAGSIDQSKTAISGAAGTVKKLEDNNKTARQLIAECQQILERVRARDEGKTAKP